MKVSIVSPVFKAEGILYELVSRISEVMTSTTYEFEIILVEDASPDNSWAEILSLAKENSFVKGIRLSRNFGQHPAIKAGISQAQGDCCVVMDCDLQDDPKYIPELIDRWKQGVDIVYTVKEKRQHIWYKNIWTKFFTLLFNFLVNDKQNESNKNVGSFSLISRKVMKAFGEFNDYQYHYLMVLRWLGFNSTYINIKHNNRFLGESSYTFKTLFEHAIVAIVFHSDKLLRLSIYWGFLISLVSIIAGIVTVVMHFTTGFQPGWASLYVLVSFSTGILLLAIGIIGLYLGRVFEQVKNRPRFVVDETINMK